MAPWYLTRKRFIAWLKDKDPSDWVGWREDMNSCPLAWYISDTTSFSWVEVKTDMLFHHGKEGNEQTPWSIELPQWAQDFVRMVDGLNNEYVQVWQALEILGVKDAA